MFFPTSSKPPSGIILSCDFAIVVVLGLGLGFWGPEDFLIGLRVEADIEPPRPFLPPPASLRPRVFLD